MQSNAETYQLVLDLVNPEKREAALLDLSKKRESVPDLAVILWNSFGTISALLQEIVSIYPLLSPPKLKAQASNRVCNALALLQVCRGRFFLLLLLFRNLKKTKTKKHSALRLIRRREDHCLSRTFPCSSIHF